MRSLRCFESLALYGHLPGFKRQDFGRAAQPGSVGDTIPMASLRSKDADKFRVDTIRELR
jgi:hypothetical protein